MDTIRTTVWRAITDKQEDLCDKALKGEKDVLAAPATDGGALGPLLVHYAKLYDDLADYCVEQYRWANEHSDLKEVRDREPWLSGMVERLGSAHSLARDRVEKAPTPFGGKIDYYKGTCLILLQSTFVRACDRLDLNLERAEAEFRNQDQKKRAERFEKFYWMALGGIGGAVVTLSTGWLAALLKIGSHG